MITDFETNTVYLSSLLQNITKYEGTLKELTAVLVSHKIPYTFLPHTKDIWARDYMPIQLAKDKFIQYRYDPDYLQGTNKGNRDIKTYPDLVCDTLGIKTKKVDILLDGGNVVKSSSSIILTDKIVKENRLFYSKQELIKVLKEAFEVERVIVIPWVKHKEDPYGHSDGMVRFINEQTVLVNALYKTDTKLLNVLKESKLNFEVLNYKVKSQHNLNWAYLNFLQTKDCLIMPKFGIEEDQLAFEQISKFYPGYLGKIKQIEMTDIVKLGGALNCISWTTLE